MCVEAIEKSKTNFKYEIIVVDNNSTDESLPYLRNLHKDKRIRLIESSKNLGYGQGNNLGVKHAKGQYVIISNTDIVVHDNTMQELVDYLKKHPKAGIVAPRLRYYNGTIQPSCRRNMSFWDLVIKRTFLKKITPFKKKFHLYLMEDFNHAEVQEVDLITGAYFIMKRTIYLQMGGFDSRFFLFMEDYDLCRTLHYAGYKVIYYPKVEAVHYHKRLSDGNLLLLFLRRIFWIHIFSALKYFWKWRGKPLIPKKSTNLK